MLVLIETGPAEALLVAERLCNAVENADFGGVKITISIGMAFYNGDPQGIDPREFVEER